MQKKPMKTPHVLIIAEAGINHNGDIKTAMEMVHVAAESGADAIKFQTFSAEKVISASAPKADYQLKTTNPGESQLEMARKLELAYDEFRLLVAECKKQSISFLSTPFDDDSIDFLVELDLGTFKIPSGEITNFPYLRKIGRLNKKVILSTGMANLGEVESAINILDQAGTKREEITILHCTTDYPTQYEDVNLAAMLTLKHAFKLPVGYSDHSLGIEIPIAAVAMGARVIEKHFTLNKAMTGPDHAASVSPEELSAMVKAIRHVEIAMGDGIKKAASGEKKNKPIARRSIVTARSIKKGDAFTSDNIVAKRPGSGISPIHWDQIVGKKALKNFAPDELIEL
jgi:N,N'-diacetyllegionaminate synthase